jgi:hypothetical protein
MSKEIDAAPVDESGFDLDQVEETEGNEITESAPVEDTQDVETEGEQDQPEEDNVQKRINKITAEKYAAKREAEELKRKLDAMESTPKAAAKMPTLEDHDFDEDAHRAALIEYQVQQALEKQVSKQTAASEAARAQEQQQAFNARVDELGKADFWEVANAVPTLPPEVVDTLMATEEGAGMIYHLGTHLDAADRLANMNPHQALIELGRMSASLNQKPPVKLSAAPEPIEPINSGGSLTKERGPDGAIYE